MESGQSVEYFNEGGDTWASGLDILSSALEQSSSESDVLSDQSVEQSQVETFSPVYDMGAYAGYDLQSVGYTLSQGVCVGFAVTLVVALASWGVACAISILRKGGNDNV